MNYVYDTHSCQPPFRTVIKGFITIKKGGDAAIYRVGQAAVAGWTPGTIFQDSVGAKAGMPLEFRLLAILPPGEACLIAP